ncbi:hypothetical protein BS47DRAFT_869237 [Hydnum rufescens UP504]|uniref:EGF-like domain-containing protein n=1 Tax=Hydnum rufescens UP504 TaxID=1448309 RepID=A0A9P6AZW5_9AGAM|nr:hypothetical protein BS47DRAFT_869237 [Hydnum rufescens UP504]
MLVDGLWAVLVQNSSSTRIVVWQSIPDFSQVSSSSAFAGSSPVSLVSLQSTTCNTPCSSSGTCTASGTCNCPPQFSGASCETCAEGFFGPSCQPCPPNCLTCDEGPTGTGKCLSTTASNLPTSCNCLNGVCSSSGSCTCNNGWATNPGNSTACSSCANGFFDNGDGECRACALNCLSCAAGSGTCTACKSGFIQDSSTPSQCIVSSGTSCHDGQFNNGGTCTACSNLCTTCSGPLSTDCIICGAGLSSLAGQCVPVNANGVCSLPNANTRNSTFIVNNAKNECDTCPSTCTSCQIPAFSITSLISQAQCTACLPGYVLSGGNAYRSALLGPLWIPTGMDCLASHVIHLVEAAPDRRLSVLPAHNLRSSPSVANASPLAPAQRSLLPAPAYLATPIVPLVRRAVSTSVLLVLATALYSPAAAGVFWRAGRTSILMQQAGAPALASRATVRVRRVPPLDHRVA